MKKPFSDIVTRLLLHPRKLERLFPSEPNDYEQVIRIRETTDTDIAGESSVRDAAAVPIVRAGLYYYFDAIEEALRELPDLPQPTPAYWRAMIFRRMGDMECARRALREAGEHPSFPELHARVSETSPNMAKQLSWDPYLFATMAEQQRFGDETALKELITLQQTEFEVFFHYTWRLAFAGS